MDSLYLFNGTCTTIEIPFKYFCTREDTLFLWLLLPIALHSLSYQLAFMTVLEFICAQAPLKMKGLLIGLWYATTSLQIHNNDRFVTEDIQWFISHGIKCGLMLFSLLLYCCVAKWYRYRARDEVVPVYLMIEDRYEREFQQREEYERELREERRALLCS